MREAVSPDELVNSAWNAFKSDESGPLHHADCDCEKASFKAGWVYAITATVLLLPRGDDK